VRSELAFAIMKEDDEGRAGGVVPIIDGIALTHRLEAFEVAAGWAQPGVPRYGGLPVGYRFGPALALYLGQAAGFTHPGRALLLGCSCGEWGCGPVWAWADADEERVRWSRFEQPHHRKQGRDHSGFGSFEFDRDQFEAAVATLGDLWPSPTNAARTRT
jgi:hypothetical protein